MELVCAILTSSTLGLLIYSLFLEHKCIQMKKEKEAILAEIEHAERDEALLHEATKRAHQILSDHIDACEFHSHDFS